MPTKMKETHPPHGLMRLGFRLPILLFRLHLGWLLGERFLLLTHKGRTSGKLHQTVIEVLQHDRGLNSYAVLSGWGERTDWVRNMEKTPDVTITVGIHTLQATSERLSSEEAEDAILDYARRNPVAIRVLPRLMGYQLDGTEADFRALAHLGVVIVFKPVRDVQEKD